MYLLIYLLPYAVACMVNILSHIAVLRFIIIICASPSGGHWRFLSGLSGRRSFVPSIIIGSFLPLIMLRIMMYARDVRKWRREKMCGQE
jgi:hypothetical protein